MNDMLKTASEGVTLVGEIIKAAGDNPQVKEAGSNLGKTALTITKTINNALLPLAAVNFAFDKARKYFDEKFADDLAAKVNAIPEESIVEPKASIAGPALQGLAFTHEEETLREMYLSLLATAIDGRISQSAHPAFVEIIKQLTGEEALSLRAIMNGGDEQAIAQIRILPVLLGNGYTVAANHLVRASLWIDGKGMVPPPTNAMIENFLRLGLIQVDYSTALQAHEEYSWVRDLALFAQLQRVKSANPPSIVPHKGVMALTAFGKQFARSVGITSA